MSTPVNPPEARISPGDLRSLMARHNIQAGEIGRRRGTSSKAVIMAKRADLIGRPYSAALMRELWSIINDILLERERELCRT